ncbi:MAG: hypothetical protein MSA09_11860 [Lachnospiraceae bacterium]|nr:hypothetical protein [Lachnospiraceae bacterium]
MNKLYSRIIWQNFPSENTALNESNLNRMDLGLDNLDNRIIEMNSTKVGVEQANQLVKEIRYDESTGKIEVEKMNGSIAAIDTKLEKLAVNFSYDSTNQKLVIILDDGTKHYVDLSELITEYEFQDGEIVYFTVKDGKVCADIKDGSISEEKLRPNFLADIKVQVSTSEQYVGQAKGYRDETKVLRDEVASDKETIDQTIKESLLEKSEEILAAMKDYYDRAQELYNSMYIDCDGENPQQRVVTIVSIDCGTPQSRLHDINGILFDGGTPLNRQLAS